MFKRVLGLIAVAGMALSLAGCGYNTIPTKEENAKTKWSDVAAAYQYRADLIPQLVSTVKGAAANERAILNDVVTARANATKVSVDASTITDPEKFKQFQEAQNGVGSALGRLMVIQENYPNLKSNDNFRDLMVAINGAQSRVLIAQKDYNAAAQDYNTELRTFPGVVWAKTAHSSAKPMAYFTALDPAAATPGGAVKAPEVNMDSVGAPASK
ncbi:LemA family lipoprotein [Asticcacaulis sp. AC460]|uniref:LemA family protein n=1 Tax=Asticcacaulis sp. AC460 TaxID=1282360 RepID=UPI0003C3B19C|nr:LemA family protein [Asticcacaulis sp. AC460]ESQ87503.1 LemA family lipoprotein [Asticcacaulis sp. AC460]